MGLVSKIKYKPILILIIGAVIFVWVLYRFLDIPLLLIIVAGAALVIFFMVATYHRGIKLEDLNINNLRQKRFNIPPRDYISYLKRAQSLLEDKIIILAEKGEGRNRDLETKLKLVESEKDKIKKMQAN